MFWRAIPTIISVGSAMADTFTSASLRSIEFSHSNILQIDYLRVGMGTLRPVATYRYCAQPDMVQYK
jgi:hypothetical protein